MNLPQMAVKRPVATATILLLILLIGLVSLYQSPLDLLPDIQPPVLAVITPFPGSSPQESLQLVTRPVEEALATVGGLSNLNSISQEGLSLVIMQFDWGMDIRRARNNVSVRMDLLDLPDGVSRPMILEFDPTLMPIMAVSASGTDDRVKLTEWLEDTAAPRLEAVPGVAGVQVQGGTKTDLFVRTSPDTMDEYQVSFEQIANIIRASLVDMPAGIIDLEDRQVRIRFVGRYSDSEMLSDLVVGFQTDQEALEELIGREVDINLNQLFAGSGTGGLLSGGALTGRSVPVDNIYWDDIFDFNRGGVVGSNIFIPLNPAWADDNAGDIESRLRLFTVDPRVTYDPNNRSMLLSLSSLGESKLFAADEPLAALDGATPRLEDIWIVEYALWDGNRAIVPLDPLSIERLDLTPSHLNDFARRHSLIVGVENNYVLVSFHENMAQIRQEPVLSIPDYRSYLSSVRRDLDRGVGDATRMIEDGLTELATAMILDSMSPGGGGAFAGFDLDDDFPITPVSLGMLAEIGEDTYSPTSITRFNRDPSISLVIQKEGDANTVQVARRLRSTLDELSAESQGGFSRIDFNTNLDQAEEIERALADLAWSLAGGAFLAIVVLILFLRNWRTTMFIGLSIPAAIITTFTLLYFTDTTINLMTLGGLALAAGMLVDNAIVVSENIYRHYQMGAAPADAAINGAREVAGAITASTLTTISVFFPVVFLSGLAGQIFWEFALTVACAILASLVVALTVIPLLASRSLRHTERRGEEEGERGKLFRQPTYRYLLRGAVRHPWWVLIFALVFVGFGGYGLTTLGSELFPATDESSYAINITLPPGSTLGATDRYVTRVEEILMKREEVLSYASRVGGSGFMGMPGDTGSANQARVRVEIIPEKVGEMDGIIAETRRQVEALDPAVSASFSRESVLDAAGLDTTLDLVVTGPELGEIMAISRQAADILADSPYFSDIEPSLEESRPEVHIRLDQEKALQKGVTQAQVALALRQALEGIPVSRLETERSILNIVLGYEKSDINTLADLGRIGFYSPGGEYLRLEDVAALEESLGPQSIPRENQEIVGRLTMDFSGIDLGGATEEALSLLEAIDLPGGYEIRPAGSFSMMEDVLSELELVVFMAILLVYLVMAAQFESLLHPFIIILSLPLAYTGAIMALVVTSGNLSVPALIGIVVLSGILVNDGIIMVDFINQQRRLHGLPLREAIVEGAAARLRPILMTTATTCLGLLPLALGFGEGGQLQAPMAITIIGGQITGTLLLLLAIPSIYLVVTRDRPELHRIPALEGGGEETIIARERFDRPGGWEKPPLAEPFASPPKGEHSGPADTFASSRLGQEGGRGETFTGTPDSAPGGEGAARGDSAHRPVFTTTPLLRHVLILVVVVAIMLLALLA